MSANGPDNIDVGAANSDGTLPHWLAQQAVAKGEAILEAQIASVGRLSTGATSILGWSVTISLALIAGISSSLSVAAAGAPPGSASGGAIFLSHLLWPALVALASTMAAAVCCVIVLWPGYWQPPGHAPDLVLNAPYDTELEVLEALAIGYAEAMHANARKLNGLEKWLRAGWVLFIGGPILGIAAYAIQMSGIIERIAFIHA